MRKSALLALAAFTSGACSSSSAGPSKDDVVSAWQASPPGDHLCREFVHFTDPEIVGTTVNGTAAEVLVRTTGDWQNITDPRLDNPSDPGFMMGPCAGFHPGTSGREVQMRMAFTKFDTGWHFESMR